MAKKQNDTRKNVISDPELRKKFKSALALITEYLRKIDDNKEGMTETIADISLEYGIDKKTVRKLASTMYKHNYGSLLEENRHFEQLYEQVVEGALRDPDDIGDPLDRDSDED